MYLSVLTLSRAWNIQENNNFVWNIDESSQASLPGFIAMFR